jgi:xanthine/uracil permease
MATRYKTAHDGPTRKWKASAAGGAGVGGVVGIIAAYVAAKVDPTMPPEVLAAVVWLVTWLLTQGAMMATGYLASPDFRDRPVVDEAASKRPVKPLPPG